MFFLVCLAKMDKKKKKFIKMVNDLVFIDDLGTFLWAAMQMLLRELFYTC